MKILVVSHNVFSDTESMGKTLSAYFSGIKGEDLAQFYIHSQVPTIANCHNYYRITDKEAIKSIFGLKVGTVYSVDDIDTSRLDARTDEGITGKVYQMARKRTPIIYTMRNIWWKLAHWNNKRFKQWIDEFQPDCVFFAAGDYKFMYDIARRISVSQRIPLFMVFMDDFFLYNKNEKLFLGRIQHRAFMKSAYKAISCASKLFCICDKMSEDYSKLFGKECITIHTPTMIDHPLHYVKQKKISYLGNLGYQRDKQLITIGKAVKELGLDVNHIDVYSSERRKEILNEMSEENGIVFHGSVGASDVKKIMGESMAVIHTESFEESIRQAVKYSVSTKIADSLASGTCIFAYGPAEIASISYLNKWSAAICCTRPEELTEKIVQLITDESKRDEVVENAYILAMNHATNRTPTIIKETISNEIKCDEHKLTDLTRMIN